MILAEKLGKWENGEFTRSDLGEAIIKTKEGKRFDSKTLKLLNECSICPVGNATCTDLITITIPEFHPEKPLREKTVDICPHGCNVDTCLLNK